MFGFACMPHLILLPLLLCFSTYAISNAQQCLSNSEIELTITGTLDGPPADSCCQNHICGLPCPETVPPPAPGFAISMAVSVLISFVVGMACFFMIKGESENYFLAGRSLPLWMVAVTLAAAAVDSNALLGNVDLSYKFQWWDGAVLPIGLALSLFLNAIFLAKHINQDNVLTLPDVFAKRYGATVEVIVSMCTITSFLMLLGGNLVGMGAITGYLWNIDEAGAVWLAALIIWSYTFTGGLFSVAYTDVVQGAMGWSGCIVAAYYLIANQFPSAPPPSVGFASPTATYVYPNQEICDMYGGVPCQNVTDACCTSPDAPVMDNGAYPIGDKPIFVNQLVDPLALSPFPNGFFWSWCTIFILGFGNLAALDFQSRCMAGKSPSAARWGCVIAGAVTLIIGIPFAYLGAMTRTFYGPDTPYAQYEADTCSTILGIPTCAEWIPDKKGFIKFMTHEAPPVLGAWCLIGIVAASMSTASGAILAMGTVFSHNVMRQLDEYVPNLVTDRNLVLAARLSTIPFTVTSSCIAAYYKSGGATGYLLIVAFDIVLATAVAPLFGAFYAKNPSPRAALCSMIFGALTRVVMEFTLPKDGYLILPVNEPEFEKYASAASANYPVFYDKVPEQLWDPTAEPCEQELYKDYTGVDSLTAFAVSVITFLTIQMIEFRIGRPLFTFPGMTPYDKSGDDVVKVGDATQKPAQELDDEKSHSAGEVIAEEDEVRDAES